MQITKLKGKLKNIIDYDLELEPTLIEQGEILLEYAAEKNLLVSNNPEQTEQLGKQVQEYSDALYAYSISEDNKSFIKKTAFLYHYSALVALTGKVTWRSLIDSRNSTKHLKLLFIFSLIFLLLTFLISLFSVAITGSGWLNSLFQYILPFAWGGLGSCVYLLKTLSDKVRILVFERRQMQGVIPRIMLGAILAMVVVNLFELGETNIPIDAVALAFLTGLGVKVVYGVLENLVEALTTYFNLGNLRTNQLSSNAEIINSPFLNNHYQPNSQAGKSEQKTTAYDFNTEAPATSATISYEIQELLAGVGLNPGNIDGEIGPRSIKTILDFLGNEAYEEDIQKLDRDLLIKWLRNGSCPENWKQYLGNQKQLVSSTIVLSAEEIQADFELLSLLQSRGYISSSVDKSDVNIVNQAVDTALEVLQSEHPDLLGMSYTGFLEKLRKDKRKKYKKVD